MRIEDLKNRKREIIKLLKIKTSQSKCLENINVIYDKRYGGEWCVIINFEYSNKKYTYREDASNKWLENEKGQEIA